jgi:hypothetical protein
MYEFMRYEITLMPINCNYQAFKGLYLIVARYKILFTIHCTSFWRGFLTSEICSLCDFL